VVIYDFLNKNFVQFVRFLTNIRKNKLKFQDFVFD